MHEKVNFVECVANVSVLSMKARSSEYQQTWQAVSGVEHPKHNPKNPASSPYML